MAKKRAFLLTMGSIILVIVAVLAWQLIRIQSQNQSGNNLVLTDLPANYCPTRAWVTVRPTQQQTSLFDKSIAVENCSTIELSSIISTQATTYSVVVKLPKALAFSVELTVPSTTDSEYAPVLGDTNDDNIINKVDIDNITSELFKTANESDEATRADIDNDGTVTVLDQTLASLHQGVGEARIDKERWETIE